MNERRARYRRGLWSEVFAAIALNLKGYRVLARRHRTPVGELDLIACRGRILAMVEVKARASLAQGLEAVGTRQQQRIARAAEAFCAQFPRYREHDLRFDVIVVVPWRWPRHIIDAWRP